MVGQLGKWAAGLAVCVWTFWAPPIAAQADCRLALLLALDVSSSVDAEEYALQRDGLASALDAPAVRNAILDSSGHVNIAIYEWSGRRQSTVVSDWIALRGDEDIDRLITNLTTAQRSHTRFPTALGYALGFGATMLSKGPICDRQVIDVSGDGENNDGFAPYLAYKNFPFNNVTVNGLAVLGSAPNVLEYFQREVRFGVGAFVETSYGYDGYRQSMTRKLLRELNDQVLSAVPVAQGPG